MKTEITVEVERLNLNMRECGGPFGAMVAFRRQALKQNWTAEQIQAVFDQAAMVEDKENVIDYLEQYCATEAPKEVSVAEPERKRSLWDRLVH